MLRLISSALLFILILSLSSLAYAATALHKGGSEVLGDFNITYSYTKTPAYVSGQYGSSPQRETDTMSGTLRTGYGYFLTDALEIGGLIDETITSSKPYKGGDPEAYITNTYQTNLDAFARYHLTKKEWILIPYVGVQAGWVNQYIKRKNEWNKKQETYNPNSYSYGAMVGAKYFISENISLNGEFNYRHFELEVLKGLPKTTTDDFKWLLGLSYYFGK